MEFCDECGSLMTPEDGVWVCPNGHEKARDSEKEKAMVTTEGQESSEVVDMSDVDNAEIGPTTTAICPKCEHDVARYEMKQIRSADESETRFFTCVECDHKWREDDH
ncbi:transcription factor S [Haloferax mediterranei ATCC 33500]|uniref:Transcription factor S n=2 Tax=Haloferax mediterranei (strain ATCC 33500 / DSM 1411 / JCM 8866 / NBRC 14739 / NCIMB 2177 / R-4) TaxID=523841 RepID=I3R4K9_HALMT|nr:transcription factor S [Haloferax mediterranei]AFK19169.1 DNA-directed RNA polymerase subunit M1 [Haloferax mediterranei ATCC 33500]AHZ21468.1 DNA-directed RNA polymerase subunit M [Haloferax mediterranei ATCC 33500]MDX5989268.1 transcription factor S [Haloferax mediterranei ATCC 33500]QCQ75639.1 transcription factor S [Haloferax mediterranei ATCC 33500]